MTTQITIYPQAEPSLSPYQQTKARAPDIENNDFFSSFADLLDVINPLQHIPGLSGLYRQLSGDEISSGARVAGGALFGGPIGLVASLANLIFEQETGGDVAQHLFANASEQYRKTDSLG
jgi:hypothetical protein